MTFRRNALPFAKMPKFRVIDGGPPEGAKKRARAKRIRDMPRCRNCGGGETLVATIGNVRSKLCVICLMQGRRVVVE